MAQSFNTNLVKSNNKNLSNCRSIMLIKYQDFKQMFKADMMAIQGRACGNSRMYTVDCGLRNKRPLTTEKLQGQK